MFGSSRELHAKLDALSKSQAVAEFNLDGTIITANENFLGALGYKLDEIQGKHHSLFVDPATRESAEYREFWGSLGRGQFQAGEYKRVAKGGNPVWIQASYNPLLGSNGKPFKVVMFAADVTAEKIRSADYESQIDAIHKTQAVIEFNLDGTIVTANENFLKTLGYSLPEIEHKHHSMFMPQAMRDSSEYRKFWDRLRSGEYQAGDFERVGKGGKRIWLQASYNPIMDAGGKLCKVVKFATDITAPADRKSVV